MSTIRAHLAEDCNGFRCGNCAAVFPQLDVIEHEVSVLEDSMYGRPPTLETKLELSCQRCASTELVSVMICQRCQEAEAQAGSDYCRLCDVIVELEELRELRIQSREQRSRELIEALIDLARPVTP